MNNLMLDLETLGTGPDAAIIQIGAIFFDKTGFGPEFCVNVDGDTCRLVGMTTTPETIAFWEKQPMNVVNSLLSDRMTIQEALAMFYSFCVTTCKASNLRVWGNGAAFDNVILKTAYDKTGLQQPWLYRHDRCFRTVKALFPDVPAPQNNTMKHNALSDARFQALHLMAISQMKNIDL